MVHGDVKPQNIFKSEFGYPALGDFGIATLGNKLGQDAPTGLSTHYAAPELIEGGAAHTSPAADQYSLGATIYTLATGRRPFESSLQESPQKVLVRALTEPVPPLPSHFPPEFNRVVLCAMARDPQRRYRDLKAFVWH